MLRYEIYSILHHFMVVPCTRYRFLEEIDILYKVDTNFTEVLGFR